MKEFIFTWKIENISYSWHKRGITTSFLFTADTLYKTSWVLIFYPRGCFLADWTSFYLYRGDDKGPEDFLFDCEFSCVSANNLVITLQSYSQMSAAMVRNHRLGCSRFLKWYEVFVQKKNLYLSEDTLTLRCRIWTQEGDVQEFGHGFGLTRIEIERILSVKNLNPGITKKETFNIHSKRQKKTLISVSTYEIDDDLLIELNPINVEQVKFYTCKVFVEGRKKKLIPCEHITSWWSDPCRELWRLHSPTTILKTKNKASVRNILKLKIEFIYATGERKKSTERIPSCSFKFQEFSSNSILSCISDRKLSDCPNIYKDLWNLYTKQILCDVELKTATASFWVHKMVLCARSLVFLAMFTIDMKEKMSNCVVIEDMKNETLEKLLQFFYTDRFEETQWDAVLELYYFSDKYQVALLKNLCISYFMDNMEAVKVGELLLMAYKHCDSYLKSKVEDYITTREEVVFGSPMWKQFTEEHPVLSVKTMLRKYGAYDNPDKTNELPSYPNILDELRFLYLGRILSDIVVKTTKSKFPAHKAILCAGSLTLKNSIVNGMSTDCVKMLDLEDDTVSRLLLFLYTDSLGDAEWHDATKLYHAAIAYQIERLKLKCSCLLLENLKPSNAAEILLLAHLHRDVRLELLLKDFISLHGKEIIGYQGLVKRKQPSPNLLARKPKRARLM